MIDFATHPWMADLLGDEEMAAIFAPEVELQRFLRVEGAWTRSLGEIEGADVGAIADSIENAPVQPQDLKAGFTRDGVPIPALVTLLKGQLGAEAEKWVHTGLTSQDVMDTSFVLALRDVLALLSARIGKLDQRLSQMQQQFGDAKLMAYTRMQPALETSAAEVIARWQQPLPALAKDLANVTRQLSQIQWGGPIGARDHPQAIELGQIFAAKLGLRDPGKAWHTDRTAIAEFAHVLSRVTTATGKIGEDVGLMAAIGSSQISLSGGGSSAMPHKNNPIQAEALIALSDFAASLQPSLTQSARHQGFRSGRAWTLEWLTVPQLCLATGAGVTNTIELMDLINSIGVNIST